MPMPMPMAMPTWRVTRVLPSDYGTPVPLMMAGADGGGDAPRVCRSQIDHVQAPRPRVAVAWFAPPWSPVGPHLAPRDPSWPWDPTFFYINPCLRADETTRRTRDRISHSRSSELRAEIGSRARDVAQAWCSPCCRT